MSSHRYQEEQYRRMFEESRSDTPEVGAMNECRVCGTPDPGKPMCFRNEQWCCDDHRKIATGSPN